MNLNSHSSALRRGLMAAAFALVSFTASAADSFEGRVHMDITSKNKEKVGIDYSMKNGKVRMDPQMPERNGHGGSMGMIMDMQTREVIILMDMQGRKMFMRRPIPQPDAEQAARVNQGRPVSPPVATGRTEMIAGYKATEYRLTDSKGEVMELWLARGLGSFMAFSGGNPMMGRGAPPPGWEGFVRDGNFFPMRVVGHDTNGAESMRMEVTNVDKGPVSDALFSTDGYAEFQMPGFGGGGGFNPFKRD